MAPANLALYFTGFDPGGTERQMIELARRLDPPLCDPRRPPGDPAVLADRICALMADARYASALGGAARAVARERYSFDRMIAAYELVYAGSASVDRRCD